MTYEINKLKIDEFGRINGVVAVNKPVGITSHDVVDRARKAFHTRAVGHSGALDPFASGLILILVGKATKLADSYLNKDKEYTAKILFGIKTDSADPEGKVLDVNNTINLNNLAETLTKFTPSYTQYVPVFSSVKVGGEKLRVLARKYKYHRVIDESETRVVEFFDKDDNIAHKIELPKHICSISYIELIDQDVADISAYRFATEWTKSDLLDLYPTAEIRVKCSKGTYIRVLAEDIGATLNHPTPAMLLELRRTKIGDFDVTQSVDIDNLHTLIPTPPVKY